MKCQNCGKREVNFHFSSNINGCVTETHLCSDCAVKSGHDIWHTFSADNTFDRFFAMLGGRGGFLPVAVPVIDFGAAFPFAVRPRAGIPTQSGACGYGCGESEISTQTTQVDEEMKRRRELYMQMSVAAENEDFEKAAQLRDKIREIESL